MFDLLVYNLDLIIKENLTHTSALVSMCEHLGKSLGDLWSRTRSVQEVRSTQGGCEQSCDLRLPPINVKYEEVEPVS